MLSFTPRAKVTHNGITLKGKFYPKVQVQTEQSPKAPPPWPLVLGPMKLLSRPEDKGLGDIIERVIGPLNGEKFKAWHKATFGRECRCERRKENWNRRYPLPS